MLAHVQSSAVLGIDAYTVHVDVDVSNGVPMMAVVGLPDAAVKSPVSGCARRSRTPASSSPTTRINMSSVFNACWISASRST